MKREETEKMIPITDPRVTELLQKTFEKALDEMEKIKDDPVRNPDYLLTKNFIKTTI